MKQLDGSLAQACFVVKHPSPRGPFPSRRLAGCALQRLPALNLPLQLALARQGVRCALGRYMAH
jgi:hypothetical protein